MASEGSSQHHGAWPTQPEEGESSSLPCPRQALPWWGDATSYPNLLAPSPVLGETSTLMGRTVSTQTPGISCSCVRGKGAWVAGEGPGPGLGPGKHCVPVSVLWTEGTPTSRGKQLGGYDGRWAVQTLSMGRRAQKA